ncbi:MAG TPA: hypothetical protein VH186_30800 [Chloroflexia bacterium]|nr:hypothetical protein [Chloroflexia bacterium]
MTFQQLNKSAGIPLFRRSRYYQRKQGLGIVAGGPHLGSICYLSSER